GATQQIVWTPFGRRTMARRAADHVRDSASGLRPIPQGHVERCPSPSAGPAARTRAQARPRTRRSRRLWSAPQDVARQPRASRHPSRGVARACGGSAHRARRGTNGRRVLRARASPSTMIVRFDRSMIDLAKKIDPQILLREYYLMKNEIITIAGSPGSGKSSTARAVAAALGFRHFSSGDLFRQLAVERGESIEAMNISAEVQRDIDLKVDNLLQVMYRTDKKLVIDSRMAWHWMPSSFK